MVNIKIERARVRVSREGITTITTNHENSYRSVNYSPEERDNLIKALNEAKAHPGKQINVPWGKDRE